MTGVGRVLDPRPRTLARAARAAGPGLALLLLGCPGDAADRASEADTEGCCETQSGTDGPGGGPGDETGDPGCPGGPCGDPPAPQDLPKSGIAGCGFEPAAFCDSFDAPAVDRGRAVELDRKYWSAGRYRPQLPTTGGQMMPIRAGWIPPCRADIGEWVLPGGDAIICDPDSNIESEHLMAVTAAQNYGVSGYRIRQPFDFADRTGTIAFDATVEPLGILLGWFALSVTEEAIAAPSFALAENDEGGAIPRNGFELHFRRACPGGGIQLEALHVFVDYVDTWIPGDQTPCIDFEPGKLNHFEVGVSSRSIEVRVSPPSSDGVTFGPAQVVLSAPVELSFTRGYVQLGVHNHAIEKYIEPGSVYTATVARFDNVGFDGPVLTNWREYEIPDPLRPSDLDGLEAVEIGYHVADLESGPADVLRFEGVEVANATGATLALTTYSLTENLGGDPSRYVFRYRLNGGPWRDRPLSADERALFDGPVVLDTTGAPVGDPRIQGILAMTIDVDLDDLVDGTNTLELVAQDIPQSYPPAVMNIDLVLAYP